MKSKKALSPTMGILLVILAVFLIAGAVALVIVFGGGLQSIVSQFDFGFLPYGESVNQITGIGVECSAGNICNGKYWNLETTNFPAKVKINGNDFEMKTTTTGVTGSTSVAKFTTIEDFSERDFKVNLIVPLFVGKAIPQPNMKIEINLINGNEKLNLINLNGILNNIIIISPSVVSNKVTLFINGEKIKTISLPSGLDNYKINIVSNSKTGFLSRSANIHPQLILKDPSFREQFGCTTQPDEQNYVVIFNEGDRINLNKLEEFTKFCLAESPAKIYTNIGGTTNTEVLAQLINGEELRVPAGQIWSIEYIGKKTAFKTDCEEDELFNINEDICLSRAAVTLICPQGSTFDFEKGICNIETVPLPFEQPSIMTHQDLEQSGSFLFSHIFEEDNINQNSFQIGEESFSSIGVSYDGSLTESIVFSDDPNNWKTFFLFKGKKYDMQVGENIQIDNLNIEVSKIDVFKPNNRPIERYIVNYVFELDVDFLETSYENGKITVTNSDETFDGGIILTKTDNLGTTTIERIENKLIKGDTEFLVDTNNILEIKVRPFVIIDTPQFEYNFDATNAIVIDVDDDKVTIVEISPQEIEGVQGLSKITSNILLQVAIGIFVIFLILVIFFVVVRLKK